MIVILYAPPSPPSPPSTEHPKLDKLRLRVFIPCRVVLEALPAPTSPRYTLLPALPIREAYTSRICFFVFLAFKQGVDSLWP